MPSKPSIYQRRVRELMVSDVVCVGPLDALSEALSLMVENRVSALPVVDANERCLGVISATDLLGLARDLGEDLNALAQLGGLARNLLVEKLTHSELLAQPVQELMSDQVVCCGPEDLLPQVAAMMVRNHVHRVVVTDGKKRVIGILSTMDLLNAFAASAES